MTMKDFLIKVLSNRHTSIAGLVYFSSKYGALLLAIWMPEAKEKLVATSDLIEGAAVAYGLVAAGDATKSATNTDVDTLKANVVSAIEHSDTSFITKPAPKNPS